MKKMRLDDIYLMAYLSDKWFTKKCEKNAPCLSSSAAPSLKLLLDRVEYRKVFNMSKLRLIHSFNGILHASFR